MNLILLLKLNLAFFPLLKVKNNEINDYSLLLTIEQLYSLFGLSKVT